MIGITGNHEGPRAENDEDWKGCHEISKGMCLAFTGSKRQSKRGNTRREAPVTELDRICKRTVTRDEELLSS